MQYVCNNQSAKFYSLVLIFSTLCIADDVTFQRKLPRRRFRPFVYFVSHASAQALRPITFTQRFRTTRHLFSIRLLRKPKILNAEDKKRSLNGQKEILANFQNLLIIFETSAIEQTHGFALYLRCWWMKFRDITASLRRTVTSLAYKLCIDMLF